MEWNVVRRWQVGGGLQMLSGPRDLQLECVRVLHETLLIPVLIDGSETMFWKEKERSRIGLYRWATSEDC